MTVSVRKLMRPDHVPVNHEWLPDVIHREAGDALAECRERVRSALAEGEITAQLRSPYGERHSIPERMWDKEPVAIKVYPRFTDGWMRMHLDGPDSPYAEGWICVPVGAVEKTLANPRVTPAAFSNSKLEDWYKEYVSAQQIAGRLPSRDEDLAAARDHFDIQIPRKTMRDLRNKHAPSEWKLPGRRKSGRK